MHAPYVLNVATTNNRIRIPSRKLLQQHLDAAAEIGATGVIVHGGHVLKNDDPAVGFDNWRKCIEGLEMPVPLLIENTAGGDNAMARRLERIARLWDAVGAARVATVGFCLDTCHAHAGGVELVALVERVMAITGRIDLVHANDSRDAFDSGADRHANFGEGEIDPDELIGCSGRPAHRWWWRPPAAARVRPPTSPGSASTSDPEYAETGHPQQGIDADSCRRCPVCPFKRSGQRLLGRDTALAERHGEDRDVEDHVQRGQHDADDEADLRELVREAGVLRLIQRDGADDDPHHRGDDAENEADNAEGLTG